MCPLCLLEQGIKGGRPLGKEDVGMEQSAHPLLVVTRLCGLPEIEMSLECSQAPDTLLGTLPKQLGHQEGDPREQETVE